MVARRARQDGRRSALSGNPRRDAALPGHGGLKRIAEAAFHSGRGIREALTSEAAVRQEAAIAAAALPASFIIAGDAWTWVALVASVLFVLAVEFLNTAVERLCNHVTPERHEAIRVTKDLASAAVFFSLLLAGIVWTVAVLEWSGFLIR